MTYAKGFSVDLIFSVLSLVVGCLTTFLCCHVICYLCVRSGYDWEHVDGRFVSISSGSLHEVWGTDIYGNIWTSQGISAGNPAGTHRWNKVQGMMSKVDIWKGQAWGVDKYQRVFHSVKML